MTPAQNGVVGGFVGTVAGVAAALSHAFGPLFLSAATIVLMALASCMPEKATGPLTLGCACGFVCFLLCYGALASVNCDDAALIAEVPIGGVWDARRLPLFVALVMLFHAAEFLFVAAHHPEDVSLRSLMLNPVPMGGYGVAMSAALIEFWVEAWGLRRLALTPGALGHVTLVAGAFLTFGGWALRTAALFTARSNFTHLIAYRRDASHVLVTHGVYRWCRHPSYVGWFVWCVASQLILGNAVACLAFAFIAWKFFAGRIPPEEELLVDFFGEEYIDYARAVPCGFPGVSRLDA